MGKRANPMAVKAALTYEIGEAAAVLEVSTATMRNWIKDGLPVMCSQKPYLISGAALKHYLQAKREEAKSPLKPNELYCLACRAGRTPLGMDVTLVPNNTKTMRLNGLCNQCGARSSRMISKLKTSEFAKVFKIKKGEEGEA